VKGTGAGWLPGNRRTQRSLTPAGGRHASNPADAADALACSAAGDYMWRLWRPALLHAGSQWEAGLEHGGCRLELMCFRSVVASKNIGRTGGCQHSADLQAHAGTQKRALGDQTPGRGVPCLSHKTSRSRGQGLRDPGLCLLLAALRALGHLRSCAPLPQHPLIVALPGCIPPTTKKQRVIANKLSAAPAQPQKHTRHTGVAEPGIAGDHMLTFGCWHTSHTGLTAHTHARTHARTDRGSWGRNQGGEGHTRTTTVRGPADDRPWAATGRPSCQPPWTKPRSVAGGRRTIRTIEHSRAAR